MEVIVPPSQHLTTPVGFSSCLYHSPSAQSEQKTESFPPLAPVRREERPFKWPLPPELIRKTILLACQDASIVPKMCLISSTVHNWVLPILYHSLRFTFAQDIVDFIGKHDVPDEHLHIRFLLVRNIYIGRTPEENGDLLYGSCRWPFPALKRLISLCSELRSLTVLYVEEKVWPQFDPLLPPHLDKFTLGPMHGSIDPRRFNFTPPITYLTSAYTCLSDDEVEDIVMLPTLKKVRKFCEANSMGPLWAVNQAPIATRSAHLKEYEIVICGPPDYTEPACNFAKQSLQEMGVDSRVVLREAPSGSWVGVVHQEFLDFRQRFIASQ